MIDDHCISPSYSQSCIKPNGFSVEESLIVNGMRNTQRSDFGTRLLAARNHADLTQTQLAKEVGMAQATYGKLENVGQGSSYTPSIAQACGVNALWLSTGHGSMLGATAAPAVGRHVESSDSLKQRREFMLADIGDMLQQFRSASELRTAYARVLACIDQYTAELTKQSVPQALEPKAPLPSVAVEPKTKPARAR